MKHRMILKTKDGQVIVRPKAPDGPVRIGKNVVATLSDAGKVAWDAGEDLDLHKGHFICLGDARAILKADFN